jgi:hypothetical protein
MPRAAPNGERISADRRSLPRRHCRTLAWPARTLPSVLSVRGPDVLGCEEWPRLAACNARLQSRPCARPPSPSRSCWRFSAGIPAGATSPPRPVDAAALRNALAKGGYKCHGWASAKKTAPGASSQGSCILNGSKPIQPLLMTVYDVHQDARQLLEASLPSTCANALAGEQPILTAVLGPNWVLGVLNSSLQARLAKALHAQRFTYDCRTATNG